MTLKKTILLYSFLLVIATALLIFFIIYSRMSRAELSVVEQRVQASIALAAEYRASSMSLTSNVQQYAVTGDKRYRDAYQQIVDYRTGKVPRHSGRFVAPGQTIPLMDLIRNAGFAHDELVLLEEANKRSSNLVGLETEAINAVEGLFPDARGQFTVRGMPDKEKAISLVFGDEYAKHTTSIMEPLDELNHEMNEHMNLELKEIGGKFDSAMLGFQIIAAALVVFCAVFLFRINRHVINPVVRCDDFSEDLANGNFETELKYSSKNEIGMLADSLRDIQHSMKMMMEGFDRVRHKVDHGDLKFAGDPSKYKGGFAELVVIINKILGRLRNMMDAIPSPVVVLDENLKCTYANKVAQDVAGLDYEGKTCGQLMGREDFGTPQDALQLAIKNKVPSTAETTAHPRDKVMQVSYTAVPFFNHEGKLSSVLQLITDLTQIKEAQNKILSVAEEAMDISNRVASASEQLSAQVDLVSKGTDVQRDRAASTATAMEEMNSTVLEVARSASEASESADACRNKATEGSDLVGQVIQAIQLVNEVSQEINVNMEKLSEEAQAIGGVMDVISDIADQTNLLALNAAIEAARAGEAGRGFAVVADEVRKLAEKTMSATNEVGTSIRGIQASTAQNRERVVVAAESADKANQLATSSGMALNEIVDLASRNSALIASIATAAEEQSATSEEINNSVDEINRIAAETADGMTQSADAVGDLADQAQQLKELLQRLHG